MTAHRHFYSTWYLDFSQETDTLLSTMLTRATLTAEAAIAAALSQNWKQAVTINSGLLSLNKTDIDAMCRLAFAYQKTGKLTLARQMYQKVLTIDPYHQIALKNLKRLASLKRKDVRPSNTAISPILFLEEPGKTKIVECVHPAPAQILATLTSSQEVRLVAKNHCCELRDERNRYLAALPDDLSFKLLKFVSGGNRYQVFIKGMGKKTLTVFLREVSRGKRFAHQPSFTTTAPYIQLSKEPNPKESAPSSDEEHED